MIEKVRDPHLIITVIGTSEDIQYSQYCNNVKLCGAVAAAQC